MLHARIKRWFVVFLYFCATLQFVRYYSKSTIYYLNMQAYLTGHERLPFQERVLPIFFIAPLVNSRWAMAHLVHPNGFFTADRGAFYLLSLISFIVASIMTQKLYLVLSRTNALNFLVFPVFLFATMWTYMVHNEANFSYPYDFLSLAFFTSGLYFIFLRRFWPLALLIFVATLNRETTLFLVGIYILDAATIEGLNLPTHLRDRFSFRQVPWARAALLFALWCSVKLTLAHIFAHNDPSENFVRILENAGRLKVRLLPALLNICGYILPIVVIMRREIRPIRFANYLYILPVWFAIMFYTGIILETRVYGELCSLTAVALVLIIEHRMDIGARTRIFSSDSESTSRGSHAFHTESVHGTLRSQIDELDVTTVPQHQME